MGETHLLSERALRLTDTPLIHRDAVERSPGDTEKDFFGILRTNIIGWTGRAGTLSLQISDRFCTFGRRKFQEVRNRRIKRIHSHRPEQKWLEELIKRSGQISSILPETM